MRVPFNPKLGRIKTDTSRPTDQAFIPHLHWTAEEAVAADTVSTSTARLTGTSWTHI